MDKINVFPEIYNFEFAPTFAAGYTGPGEVEYAYRREARRTFSPGDAEQAFALVCGEILQLKMGEAVFTGPLPSQVKSGLSVTLQPEDPGRHSDYCFGRIELALRSDDRAVLQTNSEKLLLTLPDFTWLTVNSSLQKNPVTFCRITSGNSGQIFAVNSGGIRGYGMELAFLFCICITPPAAEFC